MLDPYYCKRLHKRALRNSINIETGERIMALILGALFIATTILSVGIFRRTATGAISKIVAALIGIVVAPFILFAIFYMWNFLCIPARLILNFRRLKFLKRW